MGHLGQEMYAVILFQFMISIEVCNLIFAVANYIALLSKSAIVVITLSKFIHHVILSFDTIVIRFDRSLFFDVCIIVHCHLLLLYNVLFFIAIV